MKNDDKKMEKFMVSKSAGKKEGAKLKAEEGENVLPERERPINHTISGSKQDEETLLLMKRIINFFVILPLTLILIGGLGVILMKLLPPLFYIIRQIFVKFILNM